MPIIDADAHVIESERTWDYMDESMRRSRPVTVQVSDPSGTASEFWLIDGRLISKGPVSVGEMTRALQEMEDIEGRLRHMDALGTDIQVLYPTVFLRPLTTRPEVEAALCQSYNRWLADICKQGRGRLRWAVVLPMMTRDAALAELHFGKENGACAVFMRGIEGDKLAGDPYFYPIYKEAGALDMPICIHAATGNFAAHDLFPDDPGFWRFKVPGLCAFHSLVFSGVPHLIPGLRFGFIELSSQWVPYVIHDLTRRFEKRGQSLTKGLLSEYRFYVACQTDDDLPYVLSYAGEDNLVMGTDYSHADTSSELLALQRLRAIPDISQVVVDKILDHNPRRLYGL